MTTERPTRSRWLALLAPPAIGLAVLFAPTFRELAQTIWQSEEQGHGPIILAVSAWLLWQQRDALAAAAGRGAGASAWALLVFGLLLYVLGRSQDILLFEVGSLIPLLAGALAALFGWGVVRRAAFPLLFLVFMVPLPAAIIDALTGPLKQVVSEIAEELLYAAGYPVARTGVILSVGQYQLLVADACSGLNSMFSLGALGLLYLYLLRHPQPWRNAVLLLSILPIAFLANVVRVMILVLVTYHYGDEAGQGFIHGAAGMVLFLVALGLLVGLDAVLGLVARFTGRRKAA